ncbi:MAG TPA: ABC transporter substrate-binding protein [Acidimicrobiales bacterium]
MRAVRRMVVERVGRAPAARMAGRRAVRRRVVRRRVGAGVLAAAALVASAACSRPPTTGAAGNTDECPLEALDRADGPVRITLWYGGIAGATEETMRTMAERFNASQDAIEVRVSNQGASYQEVYRKYQSAASSDQGQLPEIVYTEDTYTASMVDSGNVLPAQVCMEADGYDLDQIAPVVRSSYSVDGQFVPGYANVSTPVLYYNKSHWVRAGLDPDRPPRTLDELYEQARAIRDAGVSDQPFVLRLSASYVKNWLNAIGVEMVNEGNGRDGQPTEATFDTPEARELMEFLDRMNREGLLNLYSATEGGINHYLALAQQQSSMLIETSTASLTIAAAVGGDISPELARQSRIDSSQVNLEGIIPGTAPFPGIEEPGQVLPGGGSFFILNSSSPAQQAASWRFLRFMLEPENAREWTTVGAYLPIVRDVAEDPSIERFWRDDVGGILLHTGFEQLAAAPPDQPGPLIGPYVDFSEELQRALEAILLDGADIESSLSSAEHEVTESLERYAGG